MGLKDIGETLPPGFRFYPSDEELVCHYLFKKITNEELLKGTLVEIDLHICEPWQLPEVAKLNANEWYFFSFRDRKYATGFRTNRATTTGYWKATGKDRLVLDPKTRKVVGMRKTLVFYRNRAPNGIKTGWIMHEFRLETPHMPPKEDWVLCRVFHKHKGETSNSPNNSHQNPHLFMEVTSTTGTGGTSSPPLIVPSPTHQIYHHQTYNSMIAAAYHDKSTNSFTSNPIRHEIIQTNHINSSAPLKLGLLNSDDTAVQLLNGNGDEATANNYPSSISSIMQVIGKNNCNGRDQAGDDHQNNIHQQYGSLLWDMNLDDDNNNSGLGEGFQHQQQQQQQNHHHSYHYQLIGDVCSFEDHDGIVLL